jgi:putative flippase GtrA
MTRRVRAFATVGAAGFVLQLATVFVLTWSAGWPAAVATALAVEAAVLHNFFWHQRWTWRDRTAVDGALWQRLLRFHLTTGITSIGGNVLIVLAVHRGLGLDAVIANGIAVATMSLANYLIADRYVFTRAQPALLALVLVTAMGTTPAVAQAAELSPQTLTAWNDYVAATEAALAAGPRAPESTEPTGREIRIADGLIHEWLGTVLIPGITVSQLVDALINPGTPPPQDDVIESRLLARDGNRLRVYLKVVRSAIVTVTYDTEHEVTFTRHSPQRATSRSVATSITETGGDDHGFLWKLNSYWEYRQVGSGVQVEVRSLSLSRSVPMVLRPIAGPIVTRIARESMTRTLDAVRRFGASLPMKSPQSTRSTRSTRSVS